MMLDDLTTAFLEHHLRWNPVDASFMGFPGRDGALPPADRDAPAREAAEGAALLRRLDQAGEAIDARLMRTALRHSARVLAERPGTSDPTWYSSEAVFGLVSLLLPTAPPGAGEALAARLRAVPRFFAEGQGHLAGQAFFSGATARAITELRALRRLLEGDLPVPALLLPPALAALAAFEAVVAAMPEADPRCGREHLAFVMREVHALPCGPEEALERAEAAIALADQELAAMAQRLDPERDWREQIADLHRICPEHVADAYRDCHEQAMAAAAGLVTPATEYALSFQPVPGWARDIQADTYFLAYRCPPGAAAGDGSVYWTAPGQSLATIKSTHAVHHGSIGHHTQNARARAAPSRLARIAAQDVARGIAFQAGGTMAEGWSCYAQDLMREVEGFYSPAEHLLARANDRRNAACLVADIRFHTGAWDFPAMRRQYQEVAGMPAARASYESVKTALFPGNRLMYWLGVEQIKAARRRWAGGVRAFHDGLLARGHVPVSWAIEDLFAGGIA